MKLARVQKLLQLPGHLNLFMLSSPHLYLMLPHQSSSSCHQRHTGFYMINPLTPTVAIWEQL